jgi:nucleotide-binding universal stress UspA family protein
MAFKTLMAHLELNQPNDALLAVTADLAQRLKAHVIGVATCQPIRLDFSDAYMTPEILAEDRAEIDKQMRAAEDTFRAALKGKAEGLEWRSTVTLGSLADYFALQARSTDLILTGPDIGASLFDQTRRVGIADLVMDAGRPVLIVPKKHGPLALHHALVAWKNTRECRHAVADALPLLKLAHQVTLAEIAPDEDMSRAKHHLEDVAAWLARHGVKATCKAVTAAGEDSDRLHDIARDVKADLIVAGAYGHSRLREWVLGGITGDYLLNPDRCVFISH